MVGSNSKLPVDLGRTPVDLLALSAHKLQGPKGTGCLVVRNGLVVEPLLRGGPQEQHNHSPQLFFYHPRVEQ